MSNPLLALIESAADNGSTVRFETTSSPVPLRDLLADARQLSRRLAESTEGGAIGLIMTPSTLGVTAFLAAVLSQRPTVSLPSAPRGGPRQHLEFLSRACEIASVTEILAPDDPVLAGELKKRRARDQSARHSGHGAECRASDDSLVQFTSGSLGHPRGVVISWRKVASNIEATLDRLQLQRDNVTCSWMPLSHDMGLVGLFLTALCAGSSDWAGRSHTVLLKPDWFTRKPTNWMQFLSEAKVSVTGCPPSLLPLLCRLRPRHGSALDLSALRHLIVGSEPIPATYLRDVDRHYGDAGLHRTALRPAYGMAEVGLTVSMTDAENPWGAVELEPGGEPGPVRRSHVMLGRPVRGYEAWVDPASHCLAVSGPSVFDHYLDEAAGADRDSSMLVTSDLGDVVGGEIVVFGRADDVIFAGGANVFLSDVDDTLVAAGVVRRGQVQAVASEEGRFDVLLESSTDLGNDRVRAIRQILADSLGAQPRAVKAVQRGTLCFTPSGKPRRSMTVDGLVEESDA